MTYTTLPHTDLKISTLCLGTMTWGQQNTEEEGHLQLDLAIDSGINFIDTAEMYPIPAKAATQGRTEKIIGNWLKQHGNRDQLVLASKIAGPHRSMQHIRNDLHFTKESLDEALQQSLARLQTDYLDLYQLHWPERPVNIFGKREFPYADDTRWEDNFHSVLELLNGYVKAGRIRYFGLSNETPYGLMRYMEAHRQGAARIVSVQNGYNLLNRRDEIALSEVVKNEQLGYLAYSPLAFGQLTGKYLDGATPAGARATLFPSYNRYHNAGAFEATRRYRDIATRHQLSLTHLALAYIRQQPFVTSTILGATTTAQLQENIASLEVTLTASVLREIEAVHQAIPNPAP